MNFSSFHVHSPNIKPWKVVEMPDESKTTTTTTAPAVASKGIAMTAQKSIHDLCRSKVVSAATKSPMIPDIRSDDEDGSSIDMECQKLPGYDGKDNDSDRVNMEIERSTGVQNQHDDPTSGTLIVDVLSTYLTEDVIIKIMNFCNISDLVHGIGMVNHYYHELSNRDTVGWDIHYTKNILQDKCRVRVPPIPPHKDHKNKRTLYQYSVIDSQRECITLEELCYDISGTIWSFRFKSAAGTDWTNADPWHQGQLCRKMVFYQNGTIMLARIKHPGESSLPTPPPPTTTVPVLNVHDHPVTSSSSHFVTPLSNINEEDEYIITAPPLPMTWRFLTRPMDLPTRPIGGYIRIHVGNRDVPTYTCIRSPTNNWGFVLESCWGVYANFELPPKQQRTTPNPMIGADTTAPATNNPPQQPHNDTENNNNLTVNNNNDGDALRHQQQHQPPQPPPPLNVADMQDETLLLTNEVQWREAFLYNVGARILPEGDDAAYEFDRFWHNNGNTDHR
jgi:hypothetical protein